MWQGINKNCNPGKKLCRMVDLVENFNSRNICELLQVKPRIPSSHEKLRRWNLCPDYRPDSSKQPLRRRTRREPMHGTDDSHHRFVDWGSHLISREIQSKRNDRILSRRIYRFGLLEKPIREQADSTV